MLCDRCKGDGRILLIEYKYSHWLESIYEPCFMCGGKGIIGILDWLNRIVCDNQSKYEDETSPSRKKDWIFLMRDLRKEKEYE
jgi:hypothetical protein